MAEQDYKFDVFLSYNSKDRSAVSRLAQRLKAQGLRVWLDREVLIPGRPWQVELERSIDSIYAAAILVGKDGIGPWQDLEMNAYLRRFVKSGKAVIPVLLDGCPTEPELPIFLEHFTWVDCRDDQAEEGFWRLVWGITGQMPEALFRLNQAAPDIPKAETSSDNSANQANTISTPSINVPRETTKTKIRRKKPEASNVPRETQNPGLTASQPLPGNPAIQTFRDSLKDGGLGPEMVIVPRGTFRMGDISGGGYDNERPVHTVSIAQPFAIGRHTITFEEYDYFAQTTHRRLPNDFGWGRERWPVIDVSWEDACAYALWLSQQTSKTYRLPSEAEWEYAARAGTETAYWWGNEIGKNRANCDGSGGQWSNKQTAPVGSFPANPWGLHDTVGNVWEWVQDKWHGDYQGAAQDGSAWEQGGSNNRVLRGGSWDSSPRTPVRPIASTALPTTANDFGFRLVCARPIIEL